MDSALIFCYPLFSCRSYQQFKEKKLVSFTVNPSQKRCPSLNILAFDKILLIKLRNGSLTCQQSWPDKANNIPVSMRDLPYKHLMHKKRQSTWLNIIRMQTYNCMIIHVRSFLHWKGIFLQIWELELQNKEDCSMLSKRVN